MSADCSEIDTSHRVGQCFELRRYFLKASRGVPVPTCSYQYTSFDNVGQFRRMKYGWIFSEYKCVKLVRRDHSSTKGTYQAPGMSTTVGLEDIESGELRKWVRIGKKVEVSTTRDSRKVRSRRE